MSPHREHRVTIMRRLRPLAAIAILIAASARVHAASVCGLDLFNDFLPLRTCAHDNCEQILPMPENTPVIVLRQRPNWSEVQLRNRHNVVVKGWALSRFICQDP